MKLRRKLGIAFAFTAILVVLVLVVFRKDDSAKRAAEETHRSLRAENFKTRLAEFNFHTSPENRARADIITNSQLYYSLPGLPVVDVRNPADARAVSLAAARQAVVRLNLLSMAGPDAATVLWKQTSLMSDDAEALWPDLGQTLNWSKAFLDASAAAALTGPIRVDLDANRGTHMLLPHLTALRNLSQSLGARVVSELHQNYRPAAWTNLLAATRLVTAWEPEPAEISHNVRFTMLKTAFNATWQALQAGEWTDEQLVQLQNEWAAVDFLKPIPDTVAFTRASMVGALDEYRAQPYPYSMSPLQMARSPRRGWAELDAARNYARFREVGSYEDEKELLRFFREREIEMRAAVRAASWQEMQKLSITTNLLTFQSNRGSPITSMMNLRALTSRNATGGGTFLSRVAEAEARRRLIMAALAVERYRLRNGTPPKALADIAEFAPPKALVDFMDGQPLRYRRWGENEFVLYSVGQNCVDDGGKAVDSKLTTQGNGQSVDRLLPRNKATVRAVRAALNPALDLVWPRAATPEEIKADNESKRRTAPRFPQLPEP